MSDEARGDQWGVHSIDKVGRWFLAQREDLRDQ